MSYKKNPNANPNASALGSIKSERKAAASRENGKKGGWPKGRPRKLHNPTPEQEHAEGLHEDIDPNCPECSYHG